MDRGVASGCPDVSGEGEQAGKPVAPAKVATTELGGNLVVGDGLAYQYGPPDYRRNLTTEY